MKNTTVTTVLVAFITSLAIVGRTASAGLFANFDLENGISYTFRTTSSTIGDSRNVSDQTLPFHSMVSLDSGHGATITTTYDAYDNGTTAGLSIQTSAATTALNHSVGESTRDTPSTTFSFTGPVHYTLIIYSTATILGDIGGNCYLPQFSPVVNTSVRPNMTYNFSGTVYGNDMNTLFENWGDNQRGHR